ncbi:peptidase [Microbacterium aurum]|uniref:Peptidase n=1 Tax=Microbacterium aurum TaxID=36805 RepID=A0A1P8U8W4_9MICO|nr:Trp biosynthesis-associated membrane protein [Microbacterium aurum]APZ34570.1 peptidase [Microbacterium aurum]MBM7828456.1 putative membrane protein (TIGR02234 family) [Microbacterium aurum]
MIARARMLAVLAIITGGAVAIISSTQTWLEVTLSAGATAALAVPGASALTLLAPFSLAALALGLALTVVGRVLRYVFGVLAAAIGGTLVVGAWGVATTHPLDAVASAVTEATGLSGPDAVASLVQTIDGTAWPWLTVVAGALVAVGGVLTLATAHTWRGAGRRYRTDADRTATAASSPRPHDASRDHAIDSWDDLSHGDDPTAR